MLLSAFHQARRLFSPQGDGLVSYLAGMLGQYGLQNIQAQTHLIEYLPGTLEQHLFAQDRKALFQVILPFVRKWLRVPDDYETIYEQMLSQMQEADFRATVSWLTAWGTKRE